MRRRYTRRRRYQLRKNRATAHRPHVHPLHRGCVVHTILFVTVHDNASVETVSGGRERIESPRPLGIPRPTLRSSCLRCLRSRGLAERPRPYSPPGVVHSFSSTIGWPGVSLRRAPLAATALRVARDRPFRACGRSQHRERPFRAKVNVPSTPAGKPEGLRGVAAHPSRLLRWTLAPGGSARGAG